MLLGFIEEVKRAGVPVSTKELLVLIEALEKRLVFASLEDFYRLARVLLVKDERYFDRFDLAMASYFHGIEQLENVLEAMVPEDWLKNEFLNSLTDEQKAKIKNLSDVKELLAAFKERLKEQNERHQGGSKWIGTGGTSPFGNSGYHPGGIRVGGESKNKSASKVWEQRHYKNLDDKVELGTRNLKVALRKLRKFARTGAADQLDMNDTIASTAKNAGLLDLKLVPERHNAVKVLLFLDVGGSMDPYVKVCEELFSACRTEFKHLKHFYFHNFIYEVVWQDNLRRSNEVHKVFEILHTFGRDYKVIFVGDAAMHPYEVVGQYGSVEILNEEPGQVWMQRIIESFDNVIWLNPTAKKYWPQTPSIEMISNILHGNMFPLTLEGLEQGIKQLAKRK